MSYADGENAAGERLRRGLLVTASAVLVAAAVGLLLVLPSVLV
ncbi:MAG: hypothetical protein ABEJ79_07995 [Halolamina sp.]